MVLASGLCVCVCVCVCERERERERESKGKWEPLSRTICAFYS